MKDAPYFNFFPERWLAGVALLSDAEQLAFLRLLCLQWLAGDEGLPADAAALKRAAGKGVTPALLEKFPVGEDGRRRNAKLETIRAEQRLQRGKTSAQRRQAVTARWEKHRAGRSPEQQPHGGRDTTVLRPNNGGSAAEMHFLLPTSSTDERESSAGAPASERAHAARDIAGLYPRQDAPAVVLDCILSDLEHGETVETLRRQVAACAEHIAKAPGGSGNRFVPSAKAFFSERQWRSPEAFAGRWQADGAGGAGPKVKLTTKPEGGW